MLVFMLGKCWRFITKLLHDDKYLHIFTLKLMWLCERLQSWKLINYWIETLLWIHFLFCFVLFFFNLLILFYFYFIIVYYSIFRGSKNRGSMDPVYILMDPVHGSGPRRGSMDQGSMFRPSLSRRRSLCSSRNLPPTRMKIAWRAQRLSAWEVWEATELQLYGNLSSK